MEQFTWSWNLTRFVCILFETVQSLQPYSAWSQFDFTIRWIWTCFQCPFCPHTSHRDDNVVCHLRTSHKDKGMHIRPILVIEPEEYNCRVKEKAEECFDNIDDLLLFTRGAYKRRTPNVTMQPRIRHTKSRYWNPIELVLVAVTPSHRKQ